MTEGYKPYYLPVEGNPFPDTHRVPCEWCLGESPEICDHCFNGTVEIYTNDAVTAGMLKFLNKLQKEGINYLGAIRQIQMKYKLDDVKVNRAKTVVDYWRHVYGVS